MTKISRSKHKIIIVLTKISVALELFLKKKNIRNLNKNNPKSLTQIWD